MNWTLPLHSLPRDFLRLLDNPPDPPVDPRPSATLALMRKSAGGIEVLLLQRSPKSGFIPGAWVFPGGTVDESDGDPVLHSRIHGLTPGTAEGRFGAPAPDDTSPEHPPIAYWVAAARETFEETGILLYRGRGHDPTSLAHARTRLLNGELGLEDVLEGLDAALDVGAMTYVGHWLTPECEPRRYETRFFLAEAPHQAGVSPHEKEMVDAVWISPEEALARNRAGSFRLVLPTLFTLEQLKAFRTPGAALEHLRHQAVPRRLPVPERTKDGVVFHLAD